MSFFLDHLTAVLVGAVVLMIAVGMLVQKSKDSEDAARSYAVQSSLSSFTDVLEADLDNVGAQLPPGASAVNALTPDRFSFFGLSGPGGTPAVVEYVRTPMGTAEGQTTFRVDRRLNGAVTGGAVSLTVFEVQMLDTAGGGLTVDEAARARQFRVRVERLAPASRGGRQARREVLRRAAWETTVRPLSLQTR